MSRFDEFYEETVFNDSVLDIDDFDDDDYRDYNSEYDADYDYPESHEPYDEEPYDDGDYYYEGPFVD